MTLQTESNPTSAIMRVRMLAMLVVVAAGGSAMAQSVVVFVNGDPITAIDIEQRTKFLVLTESEAAVPPGGPGSADRREAERFAKASAGASKSAMPRSTAAIASMAGRMRQSTEQLTQNLAQKGVNASTLKARIRADIVWQQLIRGRYQSRLQLSDKEICRSSTRRSRRSATRSATTTCCGRSSSWCLRAPPAATYDGRRREAEALRKTLQGLHGKHSRGPRDARRRRARPGHPLVGRPAGRASARSSTACRSGELTAPEVTRHGIEMFAVCSKNETKTDTPGRRKVRETLLAERFEQESKKYLRHAAQATP